MTTGIEIPDPPESTFGQRLSWLTGGRTLGVGLAESFALVSLDVRCDLEGLVTLEAHPFTTALVDANTWRSFGQASFARLADMVTDTVLVISLGDDTPILDVDAGEWSAREQLCSADWRVVRFSRGEARSGLLGDVERDLATTRNGARRNRGITADRENLISDLQHQMDALGEDLETATSALATSSADASTERAAATELTARLVSELETAEWKASTAAQHRSRLNRQLDEVRAEKQRRVEKLESRVARLEMDRDVARWRLESLKRRRWWRLAPALKGLIRRPWKLAANTAALRSALRPAPSLPRPTAKTPKPLAASGQPPVSAPEPVPMAATEPPPAPAAAQTVVQVVTAPISVVPRVPDPALSELRLAVIADEMTEAGFGPECELIRFTPPTWMEALERRPPHLLFVESAWRGNAGSWEYKVGSYSYPESIGLPDLTALVSWCRHRGIPTVFWNKEDPVHFTKFKEAAALFDVALTTDADLVDTYTALPGVEGRVSAALPFAAQPALHNPIGAMGGRDPRPVFAGTFYRNRHQDRQVQMEMLLDAALGFGLVIFDRMGGKVTESFGYPERFQSSILGSVPYAEMVEVYRRHKVFLNTNSVTTSPTMFSRRVFELLACGTPVVSTPSVGVAQMFGDIVRVVDSRAAADKALHELLDDSAIWADTARRGIVRIAGEHLYRDRLRTIADAAGLGLRADPPSLALVVDANDRGLIDAVIESAAREAAVIAVDGDDAAEVAGAYSRSPVRVHALGDQGDTRWVTAIEDPAHVRTVVEMATIGRLVPADIIGVAATGSDEHSYVNRLGPGPRIVSTRLHSGAALWNEDTEELVGRGARAYAIVPTT